MIQTLPNQIRVIRQNCQGEVCCCGFAIGVGTRDEKDDEQGMAHFVEHLLFKETEKRSSAQILGRMDAVGGEINAYTTKEEIFVYAICLKKDYERAMELMCDMVFHSTFPQIEIENEREVILDEINVYEDTPTDLIYDDFEKYAYRDHPFGRNILGLPEQLNTFKTEHFRRFLNRCFTTDRIVYFSLSALPDKTINRLVDKYLKDIPDSSAHSIYRERTIPKSFDGWKEVISRQTHQAHVLYGNKAYSLFDDKRIALSLLNNILGGPGMNSRLNNLLREHNGLVYTVESNTSFYSDTGLFSIYFGSDQKDVERCMHIIDKALKSLRDKAMSDAQLRAAKKQICGQIAISAEGKESTALSMGKSMLYYGCYESMDNLFSKIENLTSKQLWEVSNEVFDPRTMSQLIYL